MQAAWALLLCRIQLMWLLCRAGLSPRAPGCRASVSGTRTGLLMGGEAPRTNRLKKGFQKGSCQHPCPHDRISFHRWVLPLTVSPEEVPVLSCLSVRFSKISKWVRLRILPNYCLCLRECEIFISKSLLVSHIQALVSSKPDVPVAHLSGAGHTGFGAQCGFRPLNPWGEFYTCNILLVMHCLPRDVALDHIMSPPL